MAYGPCWFMTYAWSLPLLKVSVRPGGSNIDNLRTPVAISLQQTALVAVVCIDKLLPVNPTRPSTYYTPVAGRSKSTFIAHSDGPIRVHHRLTCRALTVTLVTNLAYMSARLLHTLDEVWLMS